VGVDRVGGGTAHVFYVPYLSAVQLFDYGRGAPRSGGGAVVGEGGRPDGGPPHLLYEFKDGRRMEERKPLAATVLDLADEPASKASFPNGHPLLHARASELHPASWFCIAWYPLSGVWAQARGFTPPTKFLAYYRPTHAALYSLATRTRATVAVQLRPVGLLGFQRKGRPPAGGPKWTDFDGVSCWRVPEGREREAASQRHAELEAALERGALSVVAGMRMPSPRAPAQAPVDEAWRRRARAGGHDELVRGNPRAGAGLPRLAPKGPSSSAAPPAPPITDHPDLNFLRLSSLTSLPALPTRGERVQDQVHRAGGAH